MFRSLIFVLALAVPMAAGGAATVALISLVNTTTASDWRYTPIPKADGDDGQQEARSGCCSHHGGVAGCDYGTGHQRCADGSDSLTCGCGE